MWCETISLKFPHDVVKLVLLFNHTQNHQAIGDLTGHEKKKMAAKGYVETDPATSKVRKTCDPMWCETILLKFPHDVVRPVLLLNHTQNNQAIGDLIGHVKKKMAAKAMWRTDPATSKVRRSIPKGKHHFAAILWGAYSAIEVVMNQLAVERSLIKGLSAKR